MIELRDLHKAFGPNHVLNGVNLTIPKGESMVIIGGSGTGKSVLLKCILGLVTPEKGAILVGGAPAAKGSRDAFLARFGMLFQGGALFDSLPVWQNVAFRLLRGAQKRPRDEARAVAVEKLRRVGLKPEVADLYPAELSGGMQKRVGLARAIADRVAMLHGGVIQWTGPVADLDTTPDPYVQQFIHGRAEGPIESVR